MGHIKITKCTIDRRDKNLAQASTIAVVLERQHTALGEIVQVFWPVACFGHFSFFCFFVYRCSPMNFGEVSSWNHCWWLVVNPNLQRINKKETRSLHHDDVGDDDVDDDDDDDDDDMNRKDATTLKPVGHQSTNWMLFCTLIAAMAAFTSYVKCSKLRQSDLTK